MIQFSLFEGAADPEAQPITTRPPRSHSARQGSTSPLLINILSGNEAPRRALFHIDNRDLSVTVQGETITLDLAGANGGRGDQITLTPELLIQIEALIHAPPESPF